MADITVYVDGTTSGTPGTNGAHYATLAAAIAGEAGAQSDFSVRAGKLNIECAAIDDTTRVNVTGFTNFSAGYYLDIYAATAARHAGVWSGDKYNLVASGDNALLTIGVPFTRLRGLQLDNPSTAYNSVTIQISCGTPGADCRIVGNIIKNGGSSNADQGIINYLYVATGTPTDYIYNNLIIAASSAACGIYDTDYAGTHYVLNNTFVGCAVGVKRAASASISLIAINNLFSGCTAAAAGTFAAGTDYNATDLSSMGYSVTGEGNTHDHVDHTFTFAGASDYHLASGDTGAKDLGVSNPGSLGLFTDDIDGVTRSGTWDIGADEYVAAAASAPSSLATLGVG